MKQYEWCNFTFDPENFPNPAEYLRELKEKFGVKICVWSKHLLVSTIKRLLIPRLVVNPYISQHSSIFEEAVQGGYLIKRKGGGVWQ